MLLFGEAPNPGPAAPVERAFGAAFRSLRPLEFLHTRSEREGRKKLSGAITQYGSPARLPATPPIDLHSVFFIAFCLDKGSVIGHYIDEYHHFRWRYGCRGLGLTDVYYSGSEEDWTAIDISSCGHGCPTDAAIHYNSQSAVRLYFNSAAKQ